MPAFSDEAALRRAMLAAMRRLADTGLNRGTSGNLSVRCGDGFLVTPSGMRVEDMAKETMVAMDFAGNVLDEGVPSTEWCFHRDILAARPEVGAVAHTHSTFATTLACQKRGVPAFHYMVAAAGGDSIRCAPYALFGSQELSDAAVEALRDRKACLLAHHGMIALGRDLDEATALAVEVEALCEQYWRVLQLGEPVVLDNAQMAEVIERFKHYGRRAPAS
jgi:L-fuculose-phosphate aldolase